MRIDVCFVNLFLGDASSKECKLGPRAYKDY